MALGQQSVRSRAAEPGTIGFSGSTSRGNSGGETVLGSSDPGGVHSDDAHRRGMRWRRRNFPESVASASTDSGTNTDPHSDANTNADAHTDAYTDAGWHSVHDYFQRRVAEIVDRIPRY